MLTPIESKVFRTPGPCYYAEYQGTRLIRRGGPAQTGTSNSLLCADTEEELTAELARRGIAVPRTPDQQAADFFRALDPALQQQFGPLFQAVSAVRSIEEKIRAVEAVTVPESLAPTKAALLAILRGEPAPARPPLA